MTQFKQSKLVGVFLLGIVLLNFPLINLFKKDQFIFGIPALYTYLLIVWIALIIFIALIVKNKKD